MPKSKNLLILLIYLAVILLTTNINAVVDHFLHPDIPYFDEEHLIVGATNGLITTLAYFFHDLSHLFKSLFIIQKGGNQR